MNMIKIIGKTRCATCDKENAILKCEGCLNTFCSNHAVDHRQELNKQMEDVEYTCDLIRQTITEQTLDLEKHPLLEKINQWEYDSIKTIREKAEDARKLLFKLTNRRIVETENKLNQLTDQLRRSHEGNDYYETDLRRWKEKLVQLEEELHVKPSKITLRQESSPFVGKIRIDTLVPQLSIPELKIKRKWRQDGITVAGGHGSGDKHNQLFNPVSVYVDDNQSLYIADYWNERIIKWMRDASNGQVVVGGMKENNPSEQLNRPGGFVIDHHTNSFFICDIGNRQVLHWPRQYGAVARTIISNIDCWGLAIDDRGYVYVSDYKKHEIKRWKIGDTNGIVVAGGHGQGNRLDQLNYPTHIFVDHEQSVYVSDRFNNRVMKWKSGAKEGIIVAGNQTEGNSMTQLSYPTGIVVDRLGTVYVADSNNHRVMCWSKEATKGSIVVGGHGHGQEAKQLYNPWGLAFDQDGNLYVADSYNHRVQKFTIDSH